MLIFNWYCHALFFCWYTKNLRQVNLSMSFSSFSMFLQGEVLKISHGKVQDEPCVPLQLTSVCWAAQTPAGCFKSKCRYLHVPISRRHRCWIQLWGFVWWHQRMFDDLNSLIQCALAALGPGCDSLGSWPFSWDSWDIKILIISKVEVSEVSSLQNLQDESVVTELGAPALFHRRHQQRQHV